SWSHYPTALQSNAFYSKTDIKQLGTVNGAKVGQGSDSSDIKLLQDGYGNNATISQWNGKNAQIDVQQFGTNNGAVVNQTASSSLVSVTQFGNGNHATASQY
ncbi:major curlin subunit CsgA, partial [Cedecea sp. P7760]|uniref:major curlin subunit CsgA n=1 Tax=Cedecea sp. P7760 TaxID=2726983 RepID=UPI0015A09D4E